MRTAWTNLSPRATGSCQPTSAQYLPNHTKQETKRFIRQTKNGNFTRFPPNLNKNMTKKTWKNKILNTTLNQDRGKNRIPKGCCLVVVRGIRFIWLCCTKGQKLFIFPCASAKWLLTKRNLFVCIHKRNGTEISILLLTEGRGIPWALRKKFS